MPEVKRTIYVPLIIAKDRLGLWQMIPGEVFTDKQEAQNWIQYKVKRGAIWIEEYFSDIATIGIPDEILQGQCPER